MNTKYGVILAVALIVIASGCNQNITSPQAPLNPGSLAADFSDGSEFLSTGAQVVNQSNVYTIYATQNVSGLPSDEIDLTIPSDATLPYTVQSSNGADVIYYDVTNNTQYEANAAQGSCSITVTQIEPTFEGTFYATTICSSIADSVRQLSNGAFNATYQ